jgi:HlyD family secretion protein
MWKVLLPGFALGMLSIAVLHVLHSQQTDPPLDPPVAPPRSPYDRFIAGAGLIEARTENLAIGSALAGIVTKVHVKVDQSVRPGDPLFELDDRALKAELHYREVAVEAARKQLLRQENQPRQEDRAISEAKVGVAETVLAEQTAQVVRTRRLFEQRSISHEEGERREHAYCLAKEQLRLARAEHTLLEAGAWRWDREVTRAAVTLTEAQANQTRTDLDRLVVRALTAGTVLQVNVRPGEYVGAPHTQALVVLGDISKLHVRVDIDENDIPRFQRSAAAQAKLRGAAHRAYGLKLIRVEPFVVPKKSLTGDSKERIDTRVLPVIYEMEHAADLFVGQQVDVFIETTEEGH